MNMNVMTLELYLDGELAGADKAAVETALSTDPRLAEMLRRLRTQRALRTATMATYAPSAGEASALAAAVLDECADEAAAPIGRVNPVMVWSRRLGGLAAMLIISAGCFYYGRSSATPRVVTKEVVQERYVLNVVTSTGELTEHVFATKEELTKFAADVQRMQSGTVVAGVM